MTVQPLTDAEAESLIATQTVNTFRLHVRVAALGAENARLQSRVAELEAEVARLGAEWAAAFPDARGG